MIIAIDAMGGDHAPEQIVLGAVQAVAKFECSIVLVGNREEIHSVLDAAPDINKKKMLDIPDGQDVAEALAQIPEGESGWLAIKHTSQVIEMDEHPVQAMRKKKDSSLVVATKLVKDGVCEAVISAGSTGAATVLAQHYLRNIKGIDRPAIATPLPSEHGVALLLDSGAIVDSKPRDLTQMALMGSIYSQYVFNVSNPKVGLLNIGEEETKGNKKMQATYPMLKKMSTINFIGNVEGRDIPKGTADVVVCDGFVGNIVLKFAEGLANTLFGMIKSAIKETGLLAQLGALLVMPALKKLAKTVDVEEYGGAPLLGVNGCCIICHGSSNAKSICSAAGVANEFIRNNVLEHIKESLDKEEILTNDSESV
ncbi:MAG: phosphate acyltransferase PlsX [Selenomonadaceae bacterium]|nr:phosphate acyltransferase PlsX [Selenomonadaceae bacterium]